MKPVDKQKIALEVASKLKHLPIETSAMPHPFLKGKKLTISQLDELHKSIQYLSKTFDLQFSSNELPPTNVPAFTAVKPKVEGGVVRIYDVTRALECLFLELDHQFISTVDETMVEFGPDNKLFKVTHGDVSETFNTPHALEAYLSNGENAYLVFKRSEGFLYWFSEEEANLLMAWEVERDRFAEESTLVHKAFNKVFRVKRHAVAFAQKKYFDAELPFAWTAGIRPTRGGLSGSAKSSGNGDVATTVNHLILKEDIQIGRLKRKADDYLCAPSKGRLANDLGVYIEELTVVLADGSKVENVPIEITCDACCKKIEALLKNK